MKEKLRLLAVFAHPDDESMGAGGALARYADEGVETYLVTATRGERGWFGPEEDYPGPQALGELREKELQAAAEALGIREVFLLDYIDGELEQADPQEVIDQLVPIIRRIRPQVVLTFDPTGAYGHPDHMAISRLAASAVLSAAGKDGDRRTGLPPHQVQKLYQIVFTSTDNKAYQSAFGELVMQVNGGERRAVNWPEWAVSTRIDTSAYWRTIWQAISCHRSQLPEYQKLLDLPESFHRNLWSEQTLLRVFSLVDRAASLEDDLFAGLRR